ncbi:MAG TPA: cohesin domain-containing protein [Candidatus Bathyarchaeia archaeon]|jgi:hypothetical protein|nr:cohesin domain-containing protein [Candidatus Bathyarchaeia archaeon]
MKVSVLWIVASIVCLSLVGLVRCDSLPVIAIDPPAVNLSQPDIGNNFDITINISNVANLHAWKVRLTWNSSVLNFSQVLEGPFLQSGGDPTLFLASPHAINGSLKEISDSILTNSSVAGSGVLATVTFKVLSEGQSDIHLNETVLLQRMVGGIQPEINATVMDGYVNIIPEFPNLAILVIMCGAITAVAVLVKKRARSRVLIDQMNACR